MERAPLSFNNHQQHQQQHQEHPTKWLLQQSRPLQQTWLSYHSSSTHPASENAAEAATAAAVTACGCNNQSYNSIVGSTLPAQHSSLLYLHPALQDRHGQCALQERSLNSLKDAPGQHYSSRDQQPKQQLQLPPRRVSVLQPEQLHSALPQQQQLLPAVQHMQHTQHAAARHSSEHFADCASSCSRLPLHGRALQAGAGAAPSAAAASAGVAAAIAAASARLHSLLGYARPCRNSTEPSADQQQQDQQQQGSTLALPACRTAEPTQAAHEHARAGVPAAGAAAAAATSDDLCMSDEQFSDPCSVMGCYGSLDANTYLGDADSAADMELDDAADNARPTHQQQHQQQQCTLQWLVASSSSMGAQELAKAAAEATTAGDCNDLLRHSNSKDAAEREHAGILQTLLQQVLNKAAVQRKRAAVLQAGPEAGSRSVRARLLITELAVYSSTGKPLVQAVPWLRSVGPPISCGCSAADLSLSNRLMSSIKLPGE
jgi:hypothetical protein